MNDSPVPKKPRAPAFSTRSGTTVLVSGCALATWLLCLALEGWWSSGDPWELIWAIAALLVLSTSGSYFAVTRREATEYAHRLANPHAPWRWRPEWCKPAIASTDAPGVGILLAGWLVVVLINGFAWGGIYLILGSEPGDNVQRTLGLDSSVQRSMLLAFLSAFVFAGLWVLVAVVENQLRRLKYGVPCFVPLSLPGEIGGQLRGSIEIPMQLGLLDDHPAELTLRCVRQAITGSGNSQRVGEDTVWETMTLLPASRLQRGPGKTRLPVEFDIPAGLPESSWRHDDTVGGGSVDMVWSLIVHAKTRGLDLQTSIIVPVFMTATSHQRVAEAAVTSDARTSTALPNPALPPAKVNMLPSGPSVGLDRWDYFQVALYNGIPTLGVVFLGWSVSVVLLLYWLENLVGSILWNRLIRRHEALTQLRGHFRSQFGISSGGREIQRFSAEHAAGTIGFTLGHGFFLLVFAFMILDGQALLSDFLWVLLLACGVAAAAVFEVQPLHQGLERRSFAWLREQARVSLWPVIAMHLGVIFGGLALASPEGGIWLALVFIGLRVCVDLGRVWYRKNPSVALCIPPIPPAGDEDDPKYRAQLQRYQACMNDEEPHPRAQRSRL